MLWATVPEAAVNEGRNARSRKHNVGAPANARNWGDVNSVSETERVEATPKQHFRCRIARRLSLHPAAYGEA